MRQVPVYTSAGLPSGQVYVALGDEGPFVARPAGMGDLVTLMLVRLVAARADSPAWMVPLAHATWLASGRTLWVEP